MASRAVKPKKKLKPDHDYNTCSCERCRTLRLELLGMKLTKDHDELLAIVNRMLKDGGRSLARTKDGKLVIVKEIEPCTLTTGRPAPPTQTPAQN